MWNGSECLDRFMSCIVSSFLMELIYFCYIIYRLLVWDSCYCMPSFMSEMKHMSHNMIIDDSNFNHIDNNISSDSESDINDITVDNYNEKRLPVTGNCNSFLIGY